MLRDVMCMECRLRSIYKALSWRCIATLTTFSIAYMFTHSIRVSLEIAVCECVAKIVLYYVHERIWSRVRWGYRLGT